MGSFSVVFQKSEFSINGIPSLRFPVATFKALATAPQAGGKVGSPKPPHYMFRFQMRKGDIASQKFGNRRGRIDRPLYRADHMNYFIRNIGQEVHRFNRVRQSKK